MTTENPYAIPSEPSIGDGEYTNVTVRIAPHNGGCEALVEICGTKYLVNETHDIYHHLWGIFDAIAGNNQCEHYHHVSVENGTTTYRDQCQNKVYEWGNVFCDEHQELMSSIYVLDHDAVSTSGFVWTGQGDTSLADAFSLFTKEVRGWSNTPVRVRLVSMEVPILSDAEITEWLNENQVGIDNAEAIATYEHPDYRTSAESA